ncbi:MAG: hypothetical protein RBT60_00980 [Candidatus Krumholzibacteria bacterium]|jgi:hypothetical protein|nr:hypothetical protein [Candidatus Krumholzibacteria bacterium]
MIMAKFRDSARRYGLRRAAGQYGHKILARAARIKFLHVLWLDRPHLAAASAEQAAGIEVRRLDGAELSRYAQDADLDMQQDFITQALAGGSACLGAFVDGTLAGYAWFGRRDMELYRGSVVAVGDDAAYSYKGLTLPNFRRRRCLTEIMRCAMALPVLPDTTHLVSLVEAANLSSLTACARMGFQRDGRLCLLGRGSRQRWFYLGGGKQVERPRIATVTKAEA